MVNKKKKRVWYKNPVIVVSIVGLIILPIFFFVYNHIIKRTSHVHIEDTLTIRLDSVPQSRYLKQIDGPSQLHNQLEKYPLIQAQKVFDEFYRGRTVRWKGKVWSAHISPYTYYRTTDRKERDSLLSINVQVEAINDSTVLITEEVYCVKLFENGFTYETIIDREWSDIVDFLNKGDSITVEGKLQEPDQLIDCKIIEK